MALIDATLPTEALLEIERLSAGGDGIGRLDSLAVFVPRTAPGDRVRVSLRRRKQYARGEIIELVRASDARVEAPCVHFERDQCGGCQWQHLSATAQENSRVQLVVDAFARIAKVTIDPPSITGAQQPFGYRRTVSYTVRGEGDARRGGFHAQSDPGAVVSIDRCLLTHTLLQTAWDGVRANFALLPSPQLRGHRADLRVSLRDLGTLGIGIVVEGGIAWADARSAALAAAVDDACAIWWIPARGSRTLVWSRGGTATDAANAAAAPVTTTETSAQSDSSAEAVERAAGFLQVNERVAALLHDRVTAIVQAEQPRHVIDGYAGFGELGCRLAESGIRVTLIERDRTAAAISSRLLPALSRSLCGTVEKRLGEALPADVVVLNPPRSGLDAAVTARLARSAPPERGAGTRAERDARSPRLLVYVSCDPATLARDVSRLIGWRVEQVECFDMFPQTAHVETVCVLRPEGIA